MNMVRYMSMIFRGTVEDYENAGIIPSVFMDASGSLQIYLCDPTTDEIQEDTKIEIKAFETNGGQFVETINVDSEHKRVKHQSESWDASDYI